MFLDILTNCKGSVGATEDDALGIMTHSVPSTKSGSCLNTCVMEKTGIVNHNFREKKILSKIDFILDKRWQIFT